MKTYTLKSVARRGSMLAAAFVVAGAAIFPAVSVSADALNPLTERSLTLSSGSPGWSYLDASGNPTFAPPNSGANGNQTGNTFTFRVSSSKTVEGFSFQYCINPAGACTGPGNIAGHGANDVDAYKNQQSDLEVRTGTGAGAPKEATNAYVTSKFDLSKGQPKAAPGWSGVNQSTNPALRTALAHPNLPNRDNSEGNFIVLHKTNLNDPWVQSTGWEMAASAKQDANSTGKANYITLVNKAVDEDEAPLPGLSLTANDYVKIVFFATDTNNIVNPGNKEFFVRINTFSTDNPANFITDPTDEDATIIDGGVTVANVMNRSIEIQTKVLETMDFSVGTVDPVTLDSTDTDTETPGVQSQLKTATGQDTHIPCSAIRQSMGGNSTLPANVLQLGSEENEFSLRTDKTYSTHSYWRLSSNSSGGATVYYSGVTLSNTVGDQIDAMGIIDEEDGMQAETPARGKEQFGLALDHLTTGNRLVSYDKERTAPSGTEQDPVGGYFQNGADNAVGGVSPSFELNMTAQGQTYHLPQLYPLHPMQGYDKGAGVVNAPQYTGDPAAFAFDDESSVIATPFAEGTEVLDCVTGKMRYVANIAATTPAGVYTTKINYIAAPQY